MQSVSHTRATLRAGSGSRDIVPDGAPVPTSRVVVACAITPPDYAGAGLSAYKLAERLDRQKRLAFVLTRTRAEGNGQRMYTDREGLPVVPEARVVRVTPERVKRRGWLGMLRDALPFAATTIALAASTTRQLIGRRATYDVVHCFTPSWLSFWVILIARSLGKQAILEATLIGRDDPQTRPPRDLLRVKYAARRLQYVLADKIVAISPALGSRFAAAGYSGKVHVITRSVDTRRFHPIAAEEQQRLRRELKLGEGEPVLLFVGQVGERKGADLLIPILARIVDTHPTAKLVIVGQVGEAPQQKELHARMLAEIEHHGLQDHVCFVSRTGTIERYMQAATLFVFPSRREGFGTVVVEAMACGAVPVALRIPGITDYMITPGVDGVYVEEDDADAFAGAILPLLANSQRLEQMGAAAVRTVRERFRTEVIDAVYSTMYVQLDARRAVGDSPRTTERAWLF